MTATYRIIPTLLIIVLFASCKKTEDPAQVPTPDVTQGLLKLSFTFQKTGLEYVVSDYLQDGTGRAVRFDKVRILFSNFRLLDANGIVTQTFPDKVILADVANGILATSELGMVNTGLLKRVAFDIGLDATTNQMDPTQFTGPPLTDQTLWISSSFGHKFLTLEGRVDSNGDGIVGGSEQAVTYQCITSAMLRTDEVNTHDPMPGGTSVVNIAIQMANILNGVNCNTTPTAVGSNATNAQLMSNLQTAVDLY